MGAEFLSTPPPDSRFPPCQQHSRLLNQQKLSSGGTPLMCSASEGEVRSADASYSDFVAMTRMLVEAGADPDLTDPSGLTALDHILGFDDSLLLSYLKSVTG